MQLVWVLKCQQLIQLSKQNKHVTCFSIIRVSGFTAAAALSAFCQHENVIGRSTCSMLMLKRYNNDNGTYDSSCTLE